MSKIVFLNGEFCEEKRAKVSIFDRGFLFGDGVYEVIPVYNKKMFDIEPFLQRFERSLEQMSLPWPMSKESYLSMLETLIEKNNLKEGGIYTQVTRGVAPREFAFVKGVEPTCMAFPFEKKILENPKAIEGVHVVSVADIRWKRRDVKSISLLAQCYAKEEADKQGAYEGWMVEEDGFVSEGTSSSAYIVKEGVIITRPLSNAILPGIRRKILLEMANKHGIKVEQRAFRLKEAYEADEAFLSSATSLILPITKIDDRYIQEGKPGKIYKKMRQLYIDYVLDATK
jgi:D-alanine transaminase